MLVFLTNLNHKPEVAIIKYYHKSLIFKKLVIMIKTKLGISNKVYIDKEISIVLLLAKFILSSLSTITRTYQL